MDIKIYKCIKKNHLICDRLKEFFSYINLDLTLSSSDSEKENKTTIDKSIKSVKRKFGAKNVEVVSKRPKIISITKTRNYTDLCRGILTEYNTEKRRFLQFIRDSSAAANCDFIESDFQHLTRKADDVLSAKSRQERAFVLGDEEADNTIGVEALYKSLLSLKDVAMQNIAKAEKVVLNDQKRAEEKRKAEEQQENERKKAAELLQQNKVEEEKARAMENKHQRQQEQLNAEAVAAEKEKAAEAAERKLENELILIAKNAEDLAYTVPEEGEISEIVRLQTYYKKMTDLAASLAVELEELVPRFGRLQNYTNADLRYMRAQCNTAARSISEILECRQNRDPNICWNGPRFLTPLPDLPDFFATLRRQKEHHKRQY